MNIDNLSFDQLADICGRNLRHIIAVSSTKEELLEGISTFEADTLRIITDNEEATVLGWLLNHPTPSQ